MTIRTARLSSRALVSLATCVIAFTIPGITRQAGAEPRGLYCSCPATSSFSHSVLESVAALPFVDGTLLRIGWDLVEPQQGQYDWTLLDAELARADQFDTDVALAVVLGSHTPAWLEAAGAQVVEYEFMGNPGQTVAPWDPVLLANWTALIAELGSRYEGHPRIKLVHMAHSSGNGFEMQLRGSTADWQAAGYTTQLHIDSWKTVMDAFAAAFPSSPLDVDVHPVLGSDLVAQEVAAYGHSTIGDRFGVFAAWWTHNNAFNVYPVMYTLLLDSADSSYAAVQVARSETVHGPEIFGEGGLAGTLQLAVDSGVQYAEVWNSDLLNPALQPAIESFAAQINGDTPCNPADLAEPLGVLDLADIGVFTAAFIGQQQPADLAPPFGVFDLADVGAFVGAFVAGCP